MINYIIYNDDNAKGKYIICAFFIVFRIFFLLFSTFHVVFSFRSYCEHCGKFDVFGFDFIYSHFQVYFISCTILVWFVLRSSESMIYRAQLKDDSFSVLVWYCYLNKIICFIHNTTEWMFIFLLSNKFCILLKL